MVLEARADGVDLARAHAGNETEASAQQAPGLSRAVDTRFEGASKEEEKENWQAPSKHVGWRSALLFLTLLLSTFWWLREAQSTSMAWCTSATSASRWILPGVSSSRSVLMDLFAICGRCGLDQTAAVRLDFPSSSITLGTTSSCRPKLRRRAGFHARWA